MQSVIERARQALGVVGDFQPTSLDAHQRMMADCREYGRQLRALEMAVERFDAHTKAFLDSSGAFLKEAPFPRQWIQVELTQPAEALHTPVPREYAPLFVAELHAQLAERLPGTLAAALEAELLRPIRLWLEAFSLAEARLGPLEGLRYKYDAARRQLEPLARQAASSGEAAQQLAEAEAGHAATLAEFEAEERATWEHLAWLVNDAARLKALLASTLQYMGQAAEGHPVPGDLLEPFPTSALRGRELQAAAEGTAEGSSGVADEPGKAAEEAAAGQLPPDYKPIQSLRHVPATAAASTPEALHSPNTAARGGEFAEEAKSPAAAAGGGSGAQQPAVAGIGGGNGGGGTKEVSPPPPPRSARAEKGAEAAAAADEPPVQLEERGGRPYEGAGAGQVEATLPDDAAHFGLGVRERRLAEKAGSPLAHTRSGPSAEEAQEARGKELVLSPAVTEEDAPAAAPVAARAAVAAELPAVLEASAAETADRQAAVPAMAAAPTAAGPDAAAARAGSGGGGFEGEAAVPALGAEEVPEALLEAVVEGGEGRQGGLVVEVIEEEEEGGAGGAGGAVHRAAMPPPPLPAGAPPVLSSPVTPDTSETAPPAAGAVQQAAPTAGGDGGGAASVVADAPPTARHDQVPAAAAAAPAPHSKALSAGGMGGQGEGGAAAEEEEGVAGGVGSTSAGSAVGAIAQAVAAGGAEEASG